VFERNNRENVETNAASTTAATAQQSVETPASIDHWYRERTGVHNYAEYEHYRLTGELPKTHRKTQPNNRGIGNLEGNRRRG
jgi:hypothetical protein